MGRSGDRRAGPGARALRGGVASASWTPSAARPTSPSSGSSPRCGREHCSYKSSRVHLQQASRPSGPRVVQGPGENAGVVDIGDGWVAVLQDGVPQPPVVHRAVPGRGHGRGRHPARRLHDGGAARSCLLDSLRFGALDAPRMTPPRGRRRARASAATATASASPPSAARSTSTRRYNGNILVNAMSRRAWRAADGIFFGRAAGAGNRVIYLGSKTGPRRHPRRHHGLRRVRRGRRARSAPPCRWATRSRRSC